MIRMSSAFVVGSISIAASFALVSACSSSSTPASSFGGGGGAGGGGSADAGKDSGGGFSFGDGSSGSPDGNTQWSDFPSAPVLDTPASSGDAGGDAGVTMAPPSNAAALFAAATAGSMNGPCLVETEVGSLLPSNWLRPRFRWESAGESLYELRIHAANQVNDLVVYTTNSSWTMPQSMWLQLALHSAAVDMTVTITGGSFDGTNLTNVSVGSSGAWGIAPVEAPGSIVYWQITGGGATGTGDLKGFQIGDESVEIALAASTVQEFATPCVGCHVSSPDGKFAIFSALVKSYSNGIASVQGASAGSAGAVPSFLSMPAQNALEGFTRGISSTSLAHWSPGDYIVLASSATDGNTNMTWAELDGTDTTSASGNLPTGGDTTKHRTSPSFSHDGKNVIYTRGSQSVDGRPSGGDNDIYTVAYNNRLGGTEVGITGASDPALDEYYPAFSPDDKWIMFDSVPAGQDTYSNPNAEVYVVPFKGGTPQRLAANDPPACSTVKSPGIENSWPHWAPSPTGAPQTVNGLTYYWVVFSTTRFDSTNRQLMMAPVVVDATGTVKQYKGVYFWNQPAGESNHTPAWDVFQIPPATVK
jgi:hypothetical protein